MEPGEYMREVSPHRIARIDSFAVILAAIIGGVFVIIAAFIQHATTPPAAPGTTAMTAPTALHAGVMKPSDESASAASQPLVTPPGNISPKHTALPSPSLQCTSIPSTVVRASVFVKVANGDYVRIDFRSIDSMAHVTSVEKLPAELSRKWLVAKDLTVLLFFGDGQSRPCDNSDPVFIPADDVCIQNLRGFVVPATPTRPSLQILNIPRAMKPAVFVRLNESGRSHLVGIPMHWNQVSTTSEVLDLPPGIPEQLGVGDVRLVEKKENGEFLVYANDIPIPVSSTRVSTFDVSTVRPFLERKP
jgi:hypothetical protein